MASDPSEELKPGDILLGHRRANTGPADWMTAKVIEKVQGTPFGHAAMYVGNGQVVHAHRTLPKPGVTVFPLDKFQRLYDYRAYRVNLPPKVRQEAADFVRNAVGKDYSVAKMYGSVIPRDEQDPKNRVKARANSEFMCSELIAAAYPSRVFEGHTVESTKPVDLAKSTNTRLLHEYVKKASGSGYYRGEASSPDTVKFKTEFQGIPLHIDRPRGFMMMGHDDKGKPWARRYRYDYGFIPKTQGGDGDGIDVFVGPNKKAHEAYWAIQRKPDGKFDEYKVFLGFDNRDEALAAYRQHIPKKLLGGMITLKVDMMKAMIGIGADGYTAGLQKAAQYCGFLSELEVLLT